MVKAWLEEVLPEEWEEGCICLIYNKNRDQLECWNYWCITLFNYANKIFSDILGGCLCLFAELAIGKYQCGFWAGKSVTDQIHSPRQILEKTRAYGISACHTFLDFKAAHDSVRWNKLHNAMEELHILLTLVNFTKTTMRDVKCKVRIQNNLSTSFQTHWGLR
jgi:hypothetical protein